MNKIIYIVNIRLPTEKAHGIQVMKNCEAFSNFKFSILNFQSSSNSQIQNNANKIQVELIVPTRVNLDIKEKDPFKFYGVAPSFKIRKLWSLDPIYLWKLPGGIYIKLQTVFFMARLF